MEGKKSAQEIDEQEKIEHRLKEIYEEVAAIRKSKPVTEQEIKSPYQILDKYVDHRFAMAMPFNYELLYKAMEEYATQKSSAGEDNAAPFRIKEVEDWIKSICGYIPKDWNYRQVVKLIQAYNEQFVNPPNN